jgi:cytochrome c oxidase subunit III
MPTLEREVTRRGGGSGDSPFRDRRPPPPPSNGNGGHDPSPGGPDAGPPISNARLGMLMLMTGETMLFGGLVGAFLVLRLGAAVWPPPLQPRLPVGLTALNTLVLVFSSYTFVLALRAMRAGERQRFVAGLGWTAFLGAVFLTIQGLEWVRLVRFGLTMSSGLYGSAFYTLIGAHALHVLGALTWLTIVLAAAARGRFTAKAHVGVAVCAMYWHFVVALWPILYVLVYLA